MCIPYCSSNGACNPPCIGQMDLKVHFIFQVNFLFVQTCHQVIGYIHPLVCLPYMVSHTASCTYSETLHGGGALPCFGDAILSAIATSVSHVPITSHATPCLSSPPPTQQIRGYLSSSYKHIGAILSA